MEEAAKQRGAASSGYGTTVFKQVYKYGGLDQSPTVFPPELGVGTFAFGGWLMPNFFAKQKPEFRADAIAKAVAGLTTTFSTAYGKHLSLEDLGSPATYGETLASKTDAKFLVCPNGDITE